MTTTPKTGLTDKFRPPKTKVCRLCNKELPIKNFNISIKGRHGYKNECRGCLKEVEEKKKEELKEHAKQFFEHDKFYL